MAQALLPGDRKSSDYERSASAVLSRKFVVQPTIFRRAEPLVPTVERLAADAMWPTVLAFGTFIPGGRLARSGAPASRFFVLITLGAQGARSLPGGLIVPSHEEAGMATVTTDTTSTGFEATGIERVEENNRQHTQLLDTMWLWWSANSVVATVALGALTIFTGLGFWGSVFVIVAFNILGVLPVAFLSTLGPKTGLAQMPLSRFAFGLQGAKLPALFNILACIGWSAVNAVIGSSFVATATGGRISQPVALVILAVLTTTISVYGYFIVHRYERYAWIPMVLLFGYVLFASASSFNLNVPITSSGLALFVDIATFGGAVFGYAVGWSSYAADYTRRQPANTDSGKVFRYAFAGVIVPCIVLEILGVLLTTSHGGNDPKLIETGPGPLFQHAIGSSTLALVVLGLLALSTIANNVPNDYSLALSSQVLGLRVRRWILTVIGAVVYVLVALVAVQRFAFNLQGFLLLIAYWLGSWNAVVLLEHRFRKGNYPVQDYENASKLPPGIAAVVSMLGGLGVAALGVNQFATIGFQGPISAAVGGRPYGADLGFPLAVVATGLLYFFLRRWEMARYKR
jgi:NCS1 nucleoside transporter family